MIGALASGRLNEGSAFTLSLDLDAVRRVRVPLRREADKRARGATEGFCCSQRRA